MGTDDHRTQESRTERAAVALTPAEKRALKVVAAARETTESELLRTTPISRILEEHDRIQGVLSEEPAA